MRTSDPGRTIDPNAVVHVTAKAWVLDESGTRWNGPTAGPTVTGAPGVGLIGGGCTSSRAAFVSASEAAAKGIAFDPAKAAWQEFDLPAGAGVRTWHAWSSSDLLVSVGTAGEPMYVLDAQSGRVRTVVRSAVPEGSLVAAAGPAQLVVVSPGRSDPVHVVDLAAR